MSLRQLRFIALGAAVGAAVLVAIWRSEQAALAQGQNPRHVHSDTAHLQFFISLPWSLAVWGVHLAIVIITGTDDYALGRFLYYTDPVVAGAGWGWLASLYRRGAPGRPPSRPAA